MFSKVQLHRRLKVKSNHDIIKNNTVHLTIMIVSINSISRRHGTKELKYKLQMHILELFSSTICRFSC